MQLKTTRRWALCSVLLTSLAIAWGASASGTLSPGGNTDPTEQGRRVYQKKIACSKCPVPGGVSDKSTAMQLVERINADEFSLSSRDRTAVVRYLSRRWRLD